MEYFHSLTMKIRVGSSGIYVITSSYLIHFRSNLWFFSYSAEIYSEHMGSWMCWHTFGTPVLGSLRQEDFEF
jgi:hypothetical protein